MNMSELADKKCVPCEGNTPPFDTKEIHKYLKKIDGWYVKALKHGALGGKISGAGGGGFLILIADSNRYRELFSEMEKQGLKRYKFGLNSGGTTVSEII